MRYGDRFRAANRHHSQYLRYIGVTLGKQIPTQVGDDVVDATNKTHLGIITIPIAMLKGSKDILKDLRERLYYPECSDLVVVDFFDVAQRCNYTVNTLSRRRPHRSRNTLILASPFTGTRKQ